MLYCAAVTLGSVITLLSNNLSLKNQPLVSQPVDGTPKAQFLSIHNVAVCG